MTQSDTHRHPEGAIVVAVATEDYEAAMTYAVDVATRTASPLHLINVLGVPAGGAYTGAYGGALEVSNTAIEKAVAMARELSLDDLEVTHERVDEGAVVPQLVAHAQDAQMIVLQHRRLPRLQRLVTGSIVNSVASRSSVPVVSVPEGWRLPESNGRVVTVAVQDPSEAEGLLRVAAEQARALDARMTVLHAWWLSSGYDVAVVDDRIRQEEQAQRNAQFAPVLEKLRADVGAIDVDLQIQHAPPTEALLDAAETSYLMVLGRRHHLLPLGTHLGPVARAVLAHSTAPVLLAPERS